MWSVLFSLLLAVVHSNPTPRASVCSPGFVKAASRALHITDASAAVCPPLPPAHHIGRSPLLPASRRYCHGKVALGVMKTTSESFGLRVSFGKFLQMESKYCGCCGCLMSPSIIPSLMQSLLTLLLSTSYMPTHEAEHQGYNKIKTRSLLSRGSPSSRRDRPQIR